MFNSIQIMAQMKKSSFRLFSTVCIASTLIFLMNMYKNNSTLENKSDGVVEETLDPVVVETFDIVKFESELNIDETKKSCYQTTKTNPPFWLCPLDLLDDSISRRIKGGMIWENTLATTLLNALEKYKPAIYVDIGSHIGTHALRMASMNHTVVAVEPSIAQLPKLAKATVLNNFQSHLTILPYAVSDQRNDHVIMTEQEDNNGKTYLKVGLPINEKVGHKHSNFETSTITFDDISDFVDSSMNVVLKIDIEGHECKALNSQSQFLKNRNIRVIAMECEFFPILLKDETVGKPCLHSMIKTLLDLGFHVQDATTGNVFDESALYNGVCPNLDYIWLKSD